MCHTRAKPPLGPASRCGRTGTVLRSLWSLCVPYSWSSCSRSCMSGKGSNSSMAFSIAALALGMAGMSAAQFVNNTGNAQFVNLLYLPL